MMLSTFYLPCENFIRKLRTYEDLVGNRLCITFLEINYLVNQYGKYKNIVGR